MSVCAAVLYTHTQYALHCELFLFTPPLSLQCEPTLCHTYSADKKNIYKPVDVALKNPVCFGFRAEKSVSTHPVDGDLRGQLNIR